MNLDVLKNQFRGSKFGELILLHLKGQSLNNLISALQGTINRLPSQFQKNEISKLIDEFNGKVFEKTFWKNDCAETFTNITDIARDRFLQNGIKPSDEDLLIVFNIVVLNFAYTAQQQERMKKFIKNSISTNIFRKLFIKKDISENYRWSIIFKKNGIPQFEMLGDIVYRILGYYMIPFGENGNPKRPWELFLRFNNNGKEIKLTKDYFTNPGTINSELYRKIEEMDPNNQIDTFKSDVFINRITGENIKIRTIEELHNNIMEMDCVFDGTYEEKQKRKREEITFFEVLESIFE